MNESLYRISCPMCTEVVTRSGLIRHQIRIHNIKPELSCDICGEMKYDKKQVRYHMQVYTKLGFLLNSFRIFKTFQSKHTVEDKFFKCPHCALNFNSKDEWRKHLNENHFSKLQICEICGLSFVNLQGYQYHVRTMHKNESYNCKFCPATFERREEVADHRKSVHSVCQICKKVCANPHALKSHMKTSHLEKMHECSVCKKRFGLIGLLKEHMLMHSEKSLVCKFCNHMFYKK